MVASIRRQSANCCFLWGTARTGTNLVCHVLEQADGVECHNEGSEAAFVKYFLKDNSVLMALVETCPKPAIFFKSFNDTPRARTVMNFFTDARAVYTMRQLDECIASFVQEFGSMGFQEWQKRLTEGAGGRSGRLLTMVSADRELYEYTRLTAANAVEMMDRYGRTPHNVAAVYYLWQNSFHARLVEEFPSRIMTIDYGRLVDAPKKEIAALALWVGCGLSQFDVSRINGGRGIRPESGSAHEVLRRQCWELYDQMLKAVPEPN